MIWKVSQKFIQLNFLVRDQAVILNLSDCPEVSQIEELKQFSDLKVEYFD